MGEGARIHGASGEIRAEAVCASGGYQPLLASPRADGAPVEYAGTGPRPLRHHQCRSFLFRARHGMRNRRHACSAMSIRRWQAQPRPAIQRTWRCSKQSRAGMRMTRLSLRARSNMPESSGDRLVEAWTNARYGGYLGAHAQFEASLAHTTRAIEILGALGERTEQALTMAVERALLQCPSRQARSGHDFRWPRALGRQRSQ